MIRVDMRLDSWGLGVKIKSLAQVEIINDGTGTPTRGNYEVSAIGGHGRVIRRAKVQNWPRESKPPLALLAEALKQLGY